MITFQDFENWYKLEKETNFGIPCEEVVGPSCACAGREENLTLIFLPGEEEFFYLKTKKRFPVVSHRVSSKIYCTVSLKKGCASCIFGGKCQVSRWRPLECRLFPVAPAFLGLGPFFDHCPYDQRVTREFFAMAQFVWREIGSKVEPEWIEFYKSFIRPKPEPLVDKGTRF